MAKFKKSYNKLMRCRCCQKLTHSELCEAKDFDGGTCEVCFESAGVENEHLDGGHDEKRADCPVCLGVNCLHLLKQKANHWENGKMKSKKSKKSSKSTKRETMLAQLTKRAERSGIVEPVVKDFVAGELNKTISAAAKRGKKLVKQLDDAHQQRDQKPVKSTKRSSKKQTAPVVERTGKDRLLFARTGKSGVVYAGSRENDPDAYNAAGEMLCATCSNVVTAASAIRKHERQCSKCYTALRKARRAA
ncbi:MAG TPA: hypothetical protein VH187_01540 [Scandinavium sp.]|jgi:hypothetical protein|uniref:hypothetical protein n=1 Tax=Scandinavium sp. TaxID=2830653 RepID=UPI002E33ADE6|nr:hypothetical protein [Scandinavium sp.]HEX4499841.1 hypothetical protein [Scandinavium sp.]